MRVKLPRDGNGGYFRMPFRAGTASVPAEPTEVFTTSPPARLIDGVSEAIRKTHAYYIDQQHRDGYWWYELESNVTITSEYLMLLRFLGLRDEARDRKMALHILRKQRPDGTWSLFWGGKGDLSTTVEAYFALKLAGFSADDPPLQKARAFILENGGVESARVFTKIFLALFGEYDWKAIPSIPVEINLLPPWFPMNIYRFSSWARSTIVPLSIILGLKPVRPVSGGEGITELYREPEKLPPLTTVKLSPLSWKRVFIALDRLIKAMETFPVRPLKERALKSTEAWIVAHQDSCGSWGGIQPAMVNSVLALVTLGHDLSSEPVGKGLEALESFTIENEGQITLQSCISPVWDTALSALALLSSGMKKDHGCLVNAAQWLASKQIFEKGDWSIKRPSLEPGGWAFEFENNWYPDVDDTAVVLMLLYRYAGEGVIESRNLKRGLDWILGMQGKDGGWGAFDVDNNMNILNQLPFGDLEAMIDPSTADLTGRVLELLGLIGYGLSDETVRRAIKFLKEDQADDGSWWGRWGVNYIYGTSTVLTGLGSIGENMSAPYVRKAVGWLKCIQKSDGGWGECCESYDDPKLKCDGQSTPSQTAWAILALIAAGEGSSDEVMRGIAYLLEKQQHNGTWDEPEFTGTGFPKHFVINYHNYRNCFPLMALGRFLSTTSEKRKHR
jgi:squalene-hopene/tetraprenyl-beta-curcumene cyclase